jgi:hypothetical protein
MIILRFMVLPFVLCLTACIPYPVYKTLQPKAVATVIDDAQRPIEGASVSLIAKAYPSGLEKSREIAMSDSRGQVEFVSEKEWRAEMMALHGWEEYVWSWCIEKRGFVTYRSDFEPAATFDTEPIVSLTEGGSTSCMEPMR